MKTSSLARSLPEIGNERPLHKSSNMERDDRIPDLLSDFWTFEAMTDCIGLDLVPKLGELRLSTND